MEPTHVAPLTPEQIAAIAAGGGFARCEDPTTRRKYELIEIEPVTISDDYVRAKVEEAYADGAGVEPLDMASVEAELQRRLDRKRESDR
jgi:hypothetical protein